MRVCGSQCHNARGVVCRCWCGGLFHGAGGEDARDTFRHTFEQIPTTEAGFLEQTWQPELFDTEKNNHRAQWRAAWNTKRLARATEHQPTLLEGEDDGQEDNRHV